MFPSIAQVASSGGVLWLLFLAVIVAGLLRRHQVGNGSLARRAATVTLLALGSIGCCLVAVVCANAAYFRVDPTSIRQLEITELHDERPVRVACRIEATDEIRRAMSLLSGAAAFLPNHDTLSDGYLVRLKLAEDDDSERNLFVFPESRERKRVDAVVARVSRRTSGMLVEAGQYSSPEFAAWVIRAVRDPLCKHRR
jgi:hypothetical protein